MSLESLFQEFWHLSDNMYFELETGQTPVLRKQ